MEKEKVDLIIENGIILTRHDSKNFKGSICVKEDKIIAVGKASRISRRFRAEKYLDAKGKVVLPGIVNAHMHECLLRGLCEDLPLMEWLKQICLPAERALKKKHMRAAALLNQLEMIKSGTTSFVDIFRYQDEAAKVAKISGLRAVLSCQIMDECYKTETIATNEKLVKKWNKKENYRISAWFGAHSPYTCSEETLLKVKEMAKKYQVGIHIHLSETKEEVEKIKKEHGVSPVEYLDKIGFLGSEVHAAHCVHLSRRDTAILKKRGVTVAYNPTSNMKLASGVAPILMLLSEGLNVGLGTDSFLSNNNLDMFEEMRFGSYLQKLSQKDASALPCREMIKMATMGGAMCFRMEKEIGSLEVGKKADLILVNLNSPHLYPIFLKEPTNLVENLVYSANGGDVDTVIVDGKILMENRRVRTLCEEEVLRFAESAALDLYAKAKSCG
jgi:5-methylthioadenosine/S-adenosylhomocysteine deaminase